MLSFLQKLISSKNNTAISSKQDDVTANSDDLIQEKPIPNCKNAFHILIITDTHCHMRKEQIEDFLSDIEDKIDIVFILGDMSERDMFVAKEIAKKLSSMEFLVIMIMMDN